MSPNREVALFSAALELPVDQRGAYLEQECADDPALRQRLEELLRVHQDAITFLENKALGAQESPMAAEASAVNVSPTSPAEKPGDRIGRYKLLQQIGEGGCGVVYMAEQEEPVRRRVALKVIKLGMDTRQVIARFEAERQALALMDHPNIAKVLDAGATDTGRPYFVMELVRGIKITDYCDENSLSTEERLKLLMQVCQAVQHAHQKGIIHRDIKASNILVTVAEPGAPGCPKVIDFGIAKATTGQQLTDKTLFTAFEQFIGTPAYMSPEQAMMTSLDIDTRTDIYSLGVLLYELLTSKTPLDQKELLAAGLEEMRRTIREKEPARPSTRLSTMFADELTTTAKHRHTDAPKLIHLVRGDLDWIVMKCLEKDRSRRYETVNGLARDIQRHLNCEPVAARPPSRLYAFQKSVRRHKFGFAAAGAVGAALAAGLVVSAWGLVKARQARHEAEQQRSHAEVKGAEAQEEATKSRQVARFLEDMLNGVGPSVAQGSDTKLLREILGKTAKRVGNDLTNQPRVEIELRGTMGRVYNAMSEYAEAEEMLRAAVTLCRKLPAGNEVQLATLLDDLGMVLWRKGQMVGARDAVTEALALRRKIPGDENLRALALALNSLATLLADGSAAEAEVPLREALAIQQKLLDPNDPAALTTKVNLAYILMRLNKADEAEAILRGVLAVERNSANDQSLMLAICLNLLGGVVSSRDNVEAEAMYRQALEIRRRIYPKEHADLAQSLSNLGRLLVIKKDFEGAEKYLTEALAMRRKLFPKGSQELGRNLVDLGDLQQREGRLAEAEASHREAWEMRRTLFGENKVSTVASLRALCSVLEAEGKLEEAARVASEHGEGEVMNRIALRWVTDPKNLDTSNGVVYAEKAVKVTSRTNRAYLCTLAVAYTEAGQFTNAAGVRQEAKALLGRSIPARDPGAATNLIDLSSLYNAPLTEAWHGPGTSDLSELPRGIQTFDDVQFDVRGLIQVAAPSMGPERYPDEVQDIPIHRGCHRLHFLHAAIFGAGVPDGTKIGSYIIHYASGTQRELPIIMGESLADWWVQPHEENKTFTIAWVGKNPASRRQSKTIRLFKSTWGNPAPGETVSTIDFIGLQKGPAPFLVAITVER